MGEPLSLREPGEPWGVSPLAGLMVISNKLEELKENGDKKKTQKNKKYKKIFI